MLRDKPNVDFGGGGNNKDSMSETAKNSARMLGLPEKEEELENLTEYNTALNRRIASISGPEDSFKRVKRKKSIQVIFNDEEDVINPEDVDPSVGRFRNLITTTVIPRKRQRSEAEDEGVEQMGVPPSAKQEKETRKPHSTYSQQTLPASHLIGFGPISAKLGMSLPNPAPDVDLYTPALPPPIVNFATAQQPEDQEEEYDPHAPKKKKYAKEAWPGRKPAPHHLI